MEWYDFLRELVLVCIGVAVKRTMYQRKVEVDMLNAVTESVLADVLAKLCSDEGLTLERQPTHSLRRSAYSHQPYVDTLPDLLRLSKWIKLN